MRRTNLFLIVTVVSLISLAAVTVAGYVVLTTPTSTPASNTYPSNWIGQMWGGMGGMMGNSVTGAQVQTSAAPWLGIAFVSLVIVSVVGVGGFVYFFAFSKTRHLDSFGSAKLETSTPNLTSTKPDKGQVSKTQAFADSPIDTVAKTLTADERRVIEVLKSHGGNRLQKYIRNETGLSRLQTHRTVARLVERGIVSLKKAGNTNNVMLSEWLRG